MGGRARQRDPDLAGLLDRIAMLEGVGDELVEDQRDRDGLADVDLDRFRLAGQPMDGPGVLQAAAELAHDQGKVDRPRGAVAPE